MAIVAALVGLVALAAVPSVALVLICFAVFDLANGTLEKLLAEVLSFVLSEASLANEISLAVVANFSLSFHADST
jgi:hypothetical protein